MKLDAIHHVAVIVSDYERAKEFVSAIWAFSGTAETIRRAAAPISWI